MTDEKINEAFFKMLKRKGWKPMETKDGCAWFGGKTHSVLAEFVDSNEIENFEGLDFLVVGWKKA
tara:strand:- start:281 stop:475 length:195 start_codon:yes stop_codon:yes gene_type:complete